MTPQQIHENYLVICNMNCETRVKVKLLSELLAFYPGCWKVIGITKNALEVFKKNEFQKVSRMGINRSHLVDRHKTYTRMIQSPNMDFDSWWIDYLNNDKTILSTSSENLSKTCSEIVYFDTDLFPARGFAWRHGKAESVFLKTLI